jgi:hypothetical protein
MKTSRVVLFTALLAAATMLSACGTSCDCPKCAGTAIVTPAPGQTTVVHPNGY